MKKILFFFLVITTQVYGQGLSNRWVMGYSCCYPSFGGLDIDFSSGTPVIDTVRRFMNFLETNGTISDGSGRTLFTSNGIYVANALNDTMLNGLGLNPGPYTTSMATHGLALPQGNLVIPFPQDSTKYYLFHETSDDPNFTWATLYLYYSVIDMSLDGSLGGVVQKNTILLNDSLVAGRITACKHANGRDWWLVVHQYHSGLVYKYLISPLGISGPTTQDLFTYRDVYFGQAVFSPQGTKFAYYEPYGDLDIFDFDRCTGDFSNFVHIDIDDSAVAGGAAFSPSGRFLYLSSIYYIYQFDLLSTNIDSSKTIVGVYDGYREQGFYQNFYLSALAPDGKIYTNCGDGSKYFHVINSPDSAGLACNFIQRGFPLPRWNAYTIPNFPNYFLSAQGGTVCDSLLSAVATVQEPKEVCHFSPNPSSGIIQLTYSLNTESTLEITNSLGIQIRTVQLSPSANSLTLDLSKAANGIYYYRIYNSAILLSTGKLIVTQ